MTNEEIIQNAPDGWTHYVLDNGTNYYFKIGNLMASISSGGWIDYIESKNVLPDLQGIRNRQDIEFIAKLEEGLLDAACAGTKKEALTIASDILDRGGV